MNLPMPNKAAIIHRVRSQCTPPHMGCPATRPRLNHAAGSKKIKAGATPALIFGKSQTSLTAPAAPIPENLPQQPDDRRAASNSAPAPAVCDHHEQDPLLSREGGKPTD